MRTSYRKTSTTKFWQYFSTGGQTSKSNQRADPTYTDKKLIVKKSPWRYFSTLRTMIVIPPPHPPFTHPPITRHAFQFVKDLTLLHPGWGRSAPSPRKKSMGGNSDNFWYIPKCLLGTWETIFHGQTTFRLVGDHWFGQIRLIFITGDPYEWCQCCLWAPKCKEKTFFKQLYLGN